MTCYYSRDVAAISSHALATPAGLVDVIAFTLTTIRQPLASCVRQMSDVRLNGAAARSLFGSKSAGYAYAVEHAFGLHAAMVACVESGDVVLAVDILSAIPGLGVVKASFVAQMLGLEASCLDSHNLARLGLKEDAFKLPKGLKPETKRAKIAAYLAVCAEHGGARYWWNTWCDYVAEKAGPNKSLATGDIVSAFHVSAVIG